MTSRQASFLAVSVLLLLCAGFLGACLATRHWYMAVSPALLMIAVGVGVSVERGRQ